MPVNISKNRLIVKNTSSANTVYINKNNTDEKHYDKVIKKSKYVLDMLKVEE